MPPGGTAPPPVSPPTRPAWPAGVTGNSLTPSRHLMESSAAEMCVSAWVSTPPVMARVSTMVNAISLLWLQGWHAPAGRRTCETPASSQARQIRPAVPVGAMKPGPGRQIVSQDNPSGVSRFGGQAGTQAPDPNAPSSQSQGGRAGSITYILPADSVLASDSQEVLAVGCRTSDRRAAT